MTDTLAKPICAKCGHTLEPRQSYCQHKGKCYCGECVHIEILDGTPPDVPCECSPFQNVAGSIAEQGEIPEVD